MNLAEYLASPDRNIFWRLSSGEHLNLLYEAIEEAERLQAELAEKQSLFDAQWPRMQHAIAVWHESNPGNHHVIPDLGVLLEWLIDERASAMAERDRMAAEAAEMTIDEAIAKAVLDNEKGGA